MFLNWDDLLSGDREVPHERMDLFIWEKRWNSHNPDEVEALIDLHNSYTGPPFYRTLSEVESPVHESLFLAKEHFKSTLDKMFALPPHRTRSNGSVSERRRVISLPNVFFEDLEICCPSLLDSHLSVASQNVYVVSSVQQITQFTAWVGRGATYGLRKEVGAVRTYNLLNCDIVHDLEMLPAPKNPEETKTIDSQITAKNALPNTQVETYIKLNRSGEKVLIETKTVEYMVDLDFPLHRHLELLYGCPNQFLAFQLRRLFEYNTYLFAGGVKDFSGSLCHLQESKEADLYRFVHADEEDLDADTGLPQSVHCWNENKGPSVHSEKLPYDDAIQWAMRWTLAEY